MSNFSFSKDFQGITDVFMRRQAYYAPLLALLENVMAADSGLSKVEREFIAAHVSAINSCQFCVDAHKSIMCKLGASQSQLDSVGQSPVIRRLYLII